jgi:hypothetical protein
MRNYERMHPLVALIALAVWAYGALWLVRAA